MAKGEMNGNGAPWYVRLAWWIVGILCKVRGHDWSRPHYDKLDREYIKCHRCGEIRWRRS